MEKNLNPYGTYPNILLKRLKECPDRIYIHLVSDNGSIKDISYSMLYEKSIQYASAFLKYNKINRGDRIVIILPTSEDFVYCFFACYFLSLCPVPAYPPFRLYDIPAYVKNLSHILKNCEPSLVITFSKAYEIILSAINRTGLKIPLISVSELQEYKSSSNFEPILPKPTDLGLIQYTSGSTGLQKGVMLTFDHLLINNEISKIQAKLTEKDVQISWLPLYHDMGLIASLFLSFYTNYPIVLMSPQYFLFNPKNWLWMIHRFKGTFSLAPNFAYSLCVKKIKEREIEGLDLSSWRLAGCGAEPIDLNTVEQFIKRYSKYGFSEIAFTPYYGLAEMTISTTGWHPDKKYLVDYIDRDVLEKKKIAKPTKDKSKAAKIFCVGKPFPAHEVKIVDENGKFLPDRHEGEVVVKGPCVMKGYFKAPEITSKVIKDGWLYTGDLGYLTEDGLFITGRKKDIIIKGGRNYYPHLIENLVHDIEGIRKGCVVAFGVYNEEKATEDIVILAETKLDIKKNRERLIKQIREKVLSTFNCMPDKVEILPPQSLHKTSSGKIQRTACRESYLKGFFKKKKKKAWLSLLKIYGENRIQAFRGFFQDQIWSRIWQEPANKVEDYPLLEDVLIDFDKLSKKLKPHKDIFPECSNFQELLFYNHTHYGDELYGYIVESEEKRRRLTFNDIFNEAQKYANALKNYGIRKGDKVITIVPPKRDFISFFFGCTLIGAIPIPIQPPFHLYDLQTYIQYLLHIIEDAKPKILISFSEIKEITKSAILKAKNNVTHILINSLNKKKYKRAFKPVKIKEDDPVLIQYTPGITSPPKGVILTHKSLLSNLKSLSKALNIIEKDILISWIPLYEISTIAAELCTFLTHIPSVLLSPEWVLRDVKVWLWTIHNYKGTISLAPGFFYQECCNLKDEELKGLDLSTWRIAFYIDTHINNKFINDFTQKFRKYGFKENALCTCYGITESGVIVTLTPPNEKVKIDRIEYDKFIKNNQALPIKDKTDELNSIEWVSLGKTIPNHEIKIVDPEGKEVKERIEGEILIKGPSLMKGYLNLPEVTKSVFSEGWLHTGDLGYIANGNLFLTSRKSNIIEKEGIKYYPNLLEASINEIQGIRYGCSAVIKIEENQEEKIIVLAEKQLGIQRPNYKIIEDIRNILEERFKCIPDDIILFPPHTLPKTITGEIHKEKCKQGYLKKTIFKTKKVWLEMLKIYSGNRLKTIKETIKVWNWFRKWREYRQIKYNDPNIIQKEMAKIIANEMDISINRLKPNTNLIKDLGLDSLKAIELLTIMEENFEISIPNKAIEDYPTLEALANYICEIRERNTSDYEEEKIEEEKIEIIKKEEETYLCLITGKNKEEIIDIIKQLYNKISKENLKDNLLNICKEENQKYSEYIEKKEKFLCLSLILQNKEDFIDKLNYALEELEESGELIIQDPQGIYFNTNPKKSKIAFLFPGQGSQYNYMLQDIRNKFQEVNEMFKKFDKIYEKIENTTLTSYINNKNKKLIDIKIAQPSILCVSLALYNLLKNFNINPDVVAGHSYGEYTASYISGIIEEDFLDTLIKETIKFKPLEATEMRMSAIATDVEKVKKVIDLIEKGVYIANKNCKLQTVISGTKFHIEQALNIFKALKISYEILPINYAFHSPLAESLKNVIKNIIIQHSNKINLPKIPIYSCITSKEFPNDIEEIKEILQSQITATVLFEDMIKKMYDDGIRVFIEVGPRNILTNFINQILKGKEYVAIASNHHLRPSLTQIYHVLGYLCSINYPINISKIY